MEKSRAIDLLDNLIGMIEDNQDNDYDTAFRMAIEALKAQLSKEGTTSDLISKTETVKRLRGVLEITVPITDHDGGYIDGIETGISIVSTMPTIQPETPCYLGSPCEYQNPDVVIPQPSPPWIPVSERLPEDMQYVLLTVRRLNNAYNNEPFISVGYIGWNQHHWWCAHDGDCEISKVEVLAWMPLPKIYKPNNK